MDATSMTEENNDGVNTIIDEAVKDMGADLVRPCYVNVILLSRRVYIYAIVFYLFNVSSPRYLCFSHGCGLPSDGSTIKRVLTNSSLIF